MRAANNTVPTITSADLEKDAHDAFRRYRMSHPLANLDTGGYVVLQHSHVSRLIDDPRLQATETAVPAQAGLTEGPLFDIFQHGMLTANDKVHERRRSPISRVLATQAIDHFRSSVRNAAESLVESFYRDGRLEIGNGFASKLPILALAEMLGLPKSEVPTFMRDVYAMNEFFRPYATPGDISKAEEAGGRLHDYLEKLMSRKWAAEANGFLSHYLTVVEAGDELSRCESLVQIVQLIIGGTESVRTAIVAQTDNLLARQSQWEEVCDDPGLVPAAVTESLRFEPGIAGVVRVSNDAIEMGGWTLPAGQLVILSTMSALRDERVFVKPDSFDIFRSDLAPAQLVFGGGPHKCVADAFGRVELEEALRVLVERLPNLKLNTRPVFVGHMFVRRSTECWVTW